MRLWLWGVVALATLAGCETPPGDDEAATVAGDYYCDTSGTAALMTQCDDQVTLLSLSADGTWTWYRNAGRFEVKDGKVDFGVESDRFQGPPTWGLAAIGPDSLTFQHAGRTTVYRRAVQADPVDLQAVAGAYCRTPCSGTENPVSLLKLEADGTWHMSSWGGSFSLADGEVTFRSGSDYDGPSTWGPATVGPGTLTFPQGTVYSHVGDNP